MALRRPLVLVNGVRSELPADDVLLGAPGRYYGPTPPLNTVLYPVWIDTTDGTEYAWYDDGDSQQWVEFGQASGVAPTAAATAGYAEGSAFPGAPSSGDKFYRTDLNLLCYFDGTRWLSCTLFRGELSAQQVIYPVSISGGTQNPAFAAVNIDASIYIVDFVLSSFHASGSTTVYWTINFDWLTSANVPTNLASMNTKTALVSGWTAQRASINAVLSNNARALRINLVPTGAPGVIYPICHYTYRKVLV